MIEGAEITFHLQNGESLSVDLSPTQTETIFKALGIQQGDAKDNLSMFSDATLKKVILPRINFELNSDDQQ